MKRVAVLGAGISGLSTAYYLKKLLPQTIVQLFEGSRVGGWIETITKQGYLFETGPRYVNLDIQALSTLELSNELGILDKIIVSRDVKDFTFLDDKQRQVPLYPTISSLTRNNFRYQLALMRSYWLNRKQTMDGLDKDLSFEAFTQQSFKFWNKADEEYMIKFALDGLQSSIGNYTSDLSKLSAKYFVEKYFLKGPEIDSIQQASESTRKFFEDSIKKKATAFTYEGGLITLVDSLLSHLNAQPDFQLISESVREIGGGRVRTSEGRDFKFDHIVSTLPSGCLAKVMNSDLSELGKVVERMESNSVWSLNFGVSEDIGFNHSGYFVPLCLQRKIVAVFYDSAIFEHLKPSVSVLANAPRDADPATLQQEVIEELQSHTGVSMSPVVSHVKLCEHSLPQYNIGHLDTLRDVEEQRPSWLSVIGSSYKSRLIQGCISESKLHVEKLLA
mmetsp:Transcript_19645/g.36207  ORF Transcript_19645/g.36207 Transcript_19645/m.36207 type:complete len:446 (-) Transcript_19645:5767-7104(-)